MTAFIKAEFIWFNGSFVPWDEANVHVMAHGLHYGSGVFEGIRCYETADGPAVFRLDAHLKRFYESAALYELSIPFSYDQLYGATLELVRKNGLGRAYIRPIAFFDAYSLSLWPKGAPVTVAIAGMPSGQYHQGGPENGVRVIVSSVRKFESAAMPAAGKACGQYINSVRAVQEALKRGCDEALLLNSKGHVAEGSGENLFVVKNGSVFTNDIDADILMGVTRDSVLTIARDLGIPVRVQPITLEDVTSADELFFSGTAVEVTPIREVDGRPVASGKPGPITRRIQETFFEIVKGERAEYRQWLAYVASPVTM